ncbi:hypothetical protein BKA67DRAFT_694691 [Truncatella angustata]|uniref:T6SS Phospholipase effector Tle1-like catalytic domain-containing protein n=1 Tax=Truncatella angustata TaxID=152316 RepID=A0A9P8RKQ3_9PEZI|nr:uncharacterized protein BKA67DRAFT_694691 [Truncatella angustata]KAH6647669.1 hypothetical protein BKA67DRAFT_694691 [Truncatella angustata]
MRMDIPFNKYFFGVGTDQGPAGRYLGGMFGHGCGEQIEEVYKYCSENVTGPDDEVWLFGFSRGAYVARAVSKMLNGGLINSSSTSKDRTRLEKLKKLTLRRSAKNNSGQRYGFLLDNPNHVPTVKFIGLFDMVNMTLNNYDVTISDDERTMNIRHAMAMNEHRSFRPYERITNDELVLDEDRSIVEAWFIGCHEDIGGGSEDDGLSLYPLQWMLLEARDCGLILDHGPPKLSHMVEDPLILTLPQIYDDVSSINSGSSNSSASLDPSPWIFRYSNGLLVTMYDIRNVHRHVDLGDQRRKLLKRTAPPARRVKHSIRLNPGRFDSLKLGDRSRAVFGGDLGKLNGYRENSLSGVILHPSVHFMMDSYYTSGLAVSLQGISSHVEHFRQIASLRALAPDRKTTLPVYPWIKDFTPSVASPTCRILVCGDTGVGKSTLLNRVFGVPMTMVNHDRQGVHDIEKGFQDANHPGIIIHDSEGFQTGETREVEAFKKFIETRSGKVVPEEKLQAIWFCVPSNSPRPVQGGLGNVLATLAKIAPSIPIIVVCTKKDLYLRDKRLSREDIEAICKPGAESNELLMTNQRELLHQKEAQITSLIVQSEQTREAWPQLQNVRFQFVFCGEESEDSRSSLYDSKSIKDLIHTTVALIDNGLTANGMIAAQIEDVEAKIDIAIERTLQFLRRAIVNSHASSILVIGSAVGTPAIARLMCNEIVTGCFGIREEMEKKVYGLLSRIISSNIGWFMVQSTLTGMVTVASGLSLSATIPLFEVPSATRLLLKCACDLILILDRAFRIDGDGKFVSFDKIKTIWYAYMKGTEITQDSTRLRPRRDRVHKAVNDLIPRMTTTHALSSWKDKNISRYRLGLKDIVMDYRLHDNQTTVDVIGVDIEKELSNTTTIQEDKEDEDGLRDDLKAFTNYNSLDS